MERGFAVVRSRYSSGRLTQSVPDCETLLALAFAQGESAGSQTTQLLKLLDLYGAAAVFRTCPSSSTKVGLRIHRPPARGFLLVAQLKTPRRGGFRCKWGLYSAAALTIGH